MGLNKQKGDMYGFVSHTWNPIKGKCEHDCCYCYMKRWGKPLPPLRLDEKEMKTDLGEGNFIFVGSSTDMFAENVPARWIIDVIEHCQKYNNNKYLYQTKNPYEISFYDYYYPKNIVIGTTLETNRHYNCVGNAPRIMERVEAMKLLSQPKMKTFITIEPIMQFDLFPFIEMIKQCNPDWVNIGADSTNGRKYDLPEPTYTQVEDLISELKKFTEVKLKKNLNRLTRGKNN